MSRADWHVPRGKRGGLQGGKSICRLKQRSKKMGIPPGTRWYETNQTKNPYIECGKRWWLFLRKAVKDVDIIPGAREKQRRGARAYRYRLYAGRGTIQRKSEIGERTSSGPPKKNAAGEELLKGVTKTKDGNWKERRRMSGHRRKRGFSGG